MAHRVYSWVRQRRIAAGQTQEEVSELLGISQAQYSRLERGQVAMKLDTLFRLGEIIGFEPKDAVASADADDLIAASA
jgi:transcriptional regulator with XRE-family HTH domain